MILIIFFIIILNKTNRMGKIHVKKQKVKWAIICQFMKKISNKIMSLIITIIKILSIMKVLKKKIILMTIFKIKIMRDKKI